MAARSEIFDLYAQSYDRQKQVVIPLKDYLEGCRKDPSMYASRRDSSSFYYAVFSKDLQKVFQTMHYRYNDSSSQQSWSHVYSNGSSSVMRANNVTQDIMPDVKGMGLKDALYLLENMGIKVSVNGKGKINSQSLAPGTRLAKGVTVILELS